MHYDRRQRKPSFLALCGGLLAGVSVGLSAYAAHGLADPLMQSRLQNAALFAFGHGLALAALAPSTTRRLGSIGLYLLLLGTVLFAGSLAGAVFLGTPTTVAPYGGSALMLGWLAWAIDAVRR
ncbi:MAG TPA: DUF423 domain-containing protein [Pseudoxanthomonas sp.]|jgi:uncharacterized membrane protein YgdD (TMEM256/DUF423 family)|nr:DUF423 domain-containing protein [Pseudoxanthomonas sp.]